MLYFYGGRMRIEIENSADFESLHNAFAGYKIYGHIVFGVDGVYFVVDRIESEAIR